MVPVVTVTGTGSVVAVTLDASALDVVVSGVVLQVTVSTGGGTMAERSFLLGGSSPMGGARFHFWC